MPVYTENRAAEDVARALDMLLSPAAPAGVASPSAWMIGIGSIPYLETLGDAHPEQALLCATRLAGLLLVVRCNAATRTHLPQLFARILARSGPAPSARATPGPLRAQLRFASDPQEGRYALAARMREVLLTAHEKPLPDGEFQIVWADRRAWSGGEQIVDRHLLGGNETAVDAPLPPSLPSRDASPGRHYDLHVPGSMVLAKFASFPLALFAAPQIDYDLPVPSATTAMNVRPWPEVTTLGRGDNHASSKMVAAIEAIERYAGLLARPAAPAFLSSYAALGPAALNPLALGAHPDSSYDTPGFPYPRFDPEATVDWIWADNLINPGRTAVPASAGFYGGQPGFPQHRIFFECSSGCALGCSRHEAMLHGLLELVERDAFLLSWYRRESLDDITAALSTHDRLRWALQRIVLATGCDVRILRSTREHGIPSVTVVALANTGDGPQMAMAAGSSLTYPEAAMSALNELGGHIFFLKQMYRRPGTIDQAYRLLENNAAVRTMEDHGLVNALPESVARSSFLWSGKGSRSAEALAAEEIRATSTVGESLEAVLHRLRAARFDVFSVCQSSNLLNGVGLFSEKVLVPGFLPMTFGYHNRRLRLPRIGNLAQQLAAESLPPHPFM